MLTGLLPKPQDNWPTWVVVTYYVFTVAILIAIGIWLLLKAFPYLKRGTAGIKTRRGVPRKRADGKWMRVGPGIHPQIPFLDAIEDVSVLDQVTNCSSVLAENKKSKKQCVAEVRPIWYIVDDDESLYRGIFLADDIKDVVETLVMCAVGEAIEDAARYGSRPEVTQKALALCEASLEKYGVKLKTLGLVSVVRVPVQVLGDTLSPKSDTGGNDDEAQPDPTTVAAAAATLSVVPGSA